LCKSPCEEDCCDSLVNHFLMGRPTASKRVSEAARIALDAASARRMFLFAYFTGPATHPLCSDFSSVYEGYLKSDEVKRRALAKLLNCACEKKQGPHDSYPEERAADRTKIEQALSKFRSQLPDHLARLRKEYWQRVYDFARCEATSLPDFEEEWWSAEVAAMAREALEKMVGEELRKLPPDHPPSLANTKNA
jgi:hypothetical protein